MDDDYFLQEELSITVDHIMDSCDVEQIYELEQPEEADCAEAPTMNM